MALLAIAAGLLIGLSLGALGGGGSILTVPALVYLLGQRPHQATAASLLVVGIAAITGAVTHARARRVRFGAGIAFGLLGVAGSYAGSRASEAVAPDALLAGFSLLMLAAAGAMIARRGSPRRHGAPGPQDCPDGRILRIPAGSAISPHGEPAAGRAGPEPPLLAGLAVPPALGRADAQPAAGRAATALLERPPVDAPRCDIPIGGHPVRSLAATAVTARQAAPTAQPPTAQPPTPPVAGWWQRLARLTRAGAGRPALIAAVATGVGFITGFFGVGGGFLVVPVLVLVLGFDMAAAAGTSLLVIAIDSAAALAARAGHGGLALDWPIIATFTAAAVAGSLVGGRLAGRVSPHRLTAAFTVLIVAVACYTLARSLPGLL